MKGLVGLCFGLLTLAFAALAVTIAYFCFTVRVWLGFVAVAVFLLVYAGIVLYIKKKFDYYKAAQGKTEESRVGQGEPKQD